MALMKGVGPTGPANLMNRLVGRQVDQAVRPPPSVALAFVQPGASGALNGRQKMPSIWAGLCFVYQVLRCRKISKNPPHLAKVMSAGLSAMSGPPRRKNTPRAPIIQAFAPPATLRTKSKVARRNAQ